MTSTSPELKNLEWNDVKPIWDTQLWPGRDSEPVTSMKYLGGYDMEYKKQEPIFIGHTIDNEIISTNSYVRTERGEWRSRGLWVHPDHRGNRYAVALLQSMIDHVNDMGGLRIWTMPRREALPAYRSANFVQITNWEKHDWGENCYALLNMDAINAERKLPLGGTYV